MSLAELNSRLGVKLSADLLQQALTQSTFSYENANTPNNERLEFLGDSVLGFVVVRELYSRFPDLDEARMSKIKHEVVSAKALAKIGRELSLGEALRLGRGEELSGGRDKDNLIADAVEAIFGAVLLECGFDEAEKIVARFVFPLLDDIDSLLANSDPKQQLLELANANGWEFPKYQNAHTGPDHERVFTSHVRVGEVEGQGTGRSRKLAEAAAAANALATLRTE